MSGISTLRAIVSGFKNYNFPTPAMETLAKERARICADCKEANPDHPFSNLLEDNRTVEIKGLGCNICHCLLSAKVRQLYDGCPLEKW